MRSWAFLAKIVKSKKRKEGLAVCFTARSFFLRYDVEKLSEKILYVVPPVFDAPRAFSIEAIKPLNVSKNTGIVHASPVKYRINKLANSFDSRKAKPVKPQNMNFNLSALEGHMLLISQDDLKNSVKDGVLFEEDLDSLVECEVFDAKIGKLGTVSFVGGTEVQRLLYVQLDDNNPEGEDNTSKHLDKEQLMIPYVSEFIKDIQGSKIVVDLPQGLLELNREEK